MEVTRRGMALDDDAATRSKTQSWGARLAPPERPPLQAIRPSPAPPARARGRRHLEGRHALLLAPLFYRFPRAPRARSIRRQPGVDVAAAAVELMSLVKELVLVFGPFAPRACHTLHAACVKYLVGTPSTRRANGWIIKGRRVEPSRRRIVEICVTLRALGVVRFAKGLWVPKKRSNWARASSIENFSPGSQRWPKNGASKALLKPVAW